MRTQSPSESEFEVTSKANGKRGSKVELEAAASRSNFRTAAEILTAAGATYWLDQGTLLGCVRDHGLIPWDHDIDFGVWKAEVDRELLIAGFLDAGFQLEEVPKEMDCVHLVRLPGKKVDITFYSKENAKAITTWLAPNKGILRRIIRKIVECLEDPTRKPPPSREKHLKVLLAVAFTRMLHLLPSKIRSGLLNQMKPLTIRYPAIGVVQFGIPVELLTRLKDVMFLDVCVKIPEDAESYLSLVYGSDWMIPRRKWTWWRECGGLKPIVELASREL